MYEFVIVRCIKISTSTSTGIQSILQSSGTRRSWEHRSSSNIIFLTASCGISTRRDVIKRLKAYY